MCLVTHRSLHGVINSQACDADVVVTILRRMLSVVDWTPLCFLVDRLHVTPLLCCYICHWVIHVHAHQQHVHVPSICICLGYKCLQP